MDNSDFIKMSLVNITISFETDGRTFKIRETQYYKYIIRKIIIFIKA